MSLHKLLIYDGSFDGLLCCIYKIYESKLLVFRIVKEGKPLDDLFAARIEVETDKNKANRVWKTVIQKSTKLSHERIILAYLSEIIGEEHTIVRYIQYIIDSKKNIEQNLSHPVVQRMQDVVQMLSREKLRIKSTLRFELLKEDIYYSSIQPEYNVLPLLCMDYRKRKTNYPWIIYDVKRNYGMYYNLKELDEIHLETGIKQVGKNIFQEEEALYKALKMEHYKVHQHPNAEYKSTALQLGNQYWTYLESIKY